MKTAVGWSCNGYHQLQEILTSADAIEVTVTRVNDKRADPDTGGPARGSPDWPWR